MTTEDNHMLSQSFLYKYRNKNVQVTVEFPEQSDTNAEQEFIKRLKELYLKKIRFPYKTYADAQSSNGLQSCPAGKKGGIGDGEKSKNPA